MSETSLLELQRTVDALEKRIKKLEEYVRKVQQALARNGVKAPRL
jgi:prefoldin subunit 5